MRISPSWLLFTLHYLTLMLTSRVFASLSRLPLPPPPPNSFTSCTYEIARSQTLYNQPLQDTFASAENKRLKTPSESTFTGCLPDNPFSFNTYTKTGRGVPLASNPVCNRSLHPLEENQSCKKDHEDRCRGNEQAAGGSVAMAGKRPAKPVDHARHRVQSVQPTPALRNERTGIRDGRSKHPELQKERHDVTHVSIERIERGKPEPDAERRENREEKKGRKQRNMRGGAHAVIKSNADEHDEADGEVHEAGEHGRKRQYQPRKINFRDHALIFHDHVRRVLQRVIEIHPGDERSKIKDGIRQTLGRQFRQTPEKEREYGHRQQRLQHHPQDADGRLFVANLHIAPHKKIQQLAIGPKFAETQIKKPARRLDARNHWRTMQFGRLHRGGWRRRSSRHQTRLAIRSVISSILLGYQRSLEEKEETPRSGIQLVA